VGGGAVIGWSGGMRTAERSLGEIWLSSSSMIGDLGHGTDMALPEASKKRRILTISGVHASRESERMPVLWEGKVRLG
jgi:hypothetical protein